MKSLSDEKNAVSVGHQKPRLSLVPDFYDNAYEEAVDLAAAYGLELDEWQKYVLKGWLGEKEDGTWTCALCGLSVPRQNGKGGVLEARELYGLVVLGERILHTAHELKTAKDHFRRMQLFFEHEDLKKMVKKIVNTNGEESIQLTNGGVIRFVARSKSSGRGFSADLVVCDEAQEMDDDKFEALVPVLATAKSPQTILTGTPPRPNMNGGVFERFRKSALDEKAERLCWLEWSADRNDSLDDYETWAKANPALGYRLSIEKIQDERNAMHEDGFASERLGMWATVANSSVFDLELWADLESDIDPDAPYAIAVDVSPLRDRASIAVAAYVGNKVMVQIAQSKKGTGWVVDELLRMQSVWKPCAIVVDDGSPAASLFTTAAAKRLRLTRIQTRAVGQACGAFYDLVQNEQLLHAGQQALNTAVASARTRPLGDAFAWHRKSVDADITPLVAATLAAYGLTLKRKPKEQTTKRIDRSRMTVTVL